MRYAHLRKMILGIAVVWLFLGWFSVALPAQIKLAWDANGEADLAGYKVYHGTASRSYGTPTNVGNVTSYTLTGLTEGQTYFISLTAYDSSSNESDPSSEVSGVATTPSQTVTITVATNAAGRRLTVDGATLTAPQTFNWTTGSSHTIGVSSPQDGETSGKRYAFASWSDDGAQTHTVTVPTSARTYTATFTTQYSLTAGASAGGTVSPAGTSWHNSPEPVTVTATPNAGYSFLNWSGNLTGSSNPATVTMNAPKNVTANFSAIAGGALSVTPSTGFNSSGKKGGPFSPISTTYTLQNPGGTAINWRVSKSQPWTSLSQEIGSLSPGASATVTVSINEAANTLDSGSYTDTIAFTNTSNNAGNTTRPVNLTVSSEALITHRIDSHPTGREVWVDGVPYKTPKKFKWQNGSLHTVSTVDPQEGASGKRFRFSSWSDGGAVTHTIIAPPDPTTYTASFIVEFTLKTSVNNESRGAVNPSGLQWYEKGATVSLTGVPAVGYKFKNWKNSLGQVVGKDNPFSVTMNRAKKIKANFAHITYPLTVTKVPRGGGTVSRTPSKSNYFHGEQVTLTAKPKYGYTFVGWGGDATGTEKTITLLVDSQKAVTANFVLDPEVPQVAPTADKAEARLPLIGRLESPGDGKTLSGVKPVYGWALDGEEVTQVELFIDGQYVCRIPYGGLREDIRETHPEYPEAGQAGFALVWNYSVMPAGEHTVGVRVQNSRDETLDLSANVSVIKFHGDVVTDVNPETPTTCPVTVTADGVTKTYDVNLRWVNEVQDFGIVEIVPKD